MNKSNLQLLITTFGEENIKAFHYDNARFGHTNAGDMISKLDMTNELVYDFTPTADGEAGVTLIVSDFDQIQQVEFSLNKEQISELALLSEEDRTKIQEMFDKMQVVW